MSEGYLTDAEAAAYCAMLYRRTWSANVLAETEITQANAKLVAAEGIPKVPLYFFISDGYDIPVPNYVDLLMPYIDNAPNGQYELLDVSHYVHNLAPERIATGTKTFIDSIMELR